MWTKITQFVTVDTRVDAKRCTLQLGWIAKLCVWYSTVPFFTA